MKNRALEPSTWAGVAAMLEGAKVLLPQYAPLIVGIQAAFGGVAVVVREARR